MLVTLVAMAQGGYTWHVTENADHTLTLTFTGKIENGWHVNMSFIEVESIGGLSPLGKEKTVGNVTTQSYRITKPNYHIGGYFEFILCSDTQCLAPERIDFSYNAPSKATNTHTEATDNASDNIKAIPPDTQSTLSDSTQRDNLPATNATQADTLPLPATWSPVIDQLATLHTDTNSLPSGGTSHGGDIFIIGFLAGLLALLTPCIWPVIPLTVSFFLKRDSGSSKGALLYGLSIIMIFLLLGIVVTMLFGATALNNLATNAVFNVVCWALLTILGLSLCGLMPLRLPHSWATRLDNHATTTTGFVSIFLMALTLVVVSFSCTAPIIGMLLVEIATTSHTTHGMAAYLSPLMGMLGFASGLALPFTILALFPSLMRRIPRSGRWMSDVRVALGLLEIALAMKFLSVADLAYGWHLLSRRLFIAIWIGLALCGAVYTMLHWQRKKQGTWLQRGMLFTYFFIAVYLSNAFHGDPLTPLSAFLPPEDSGNIQQPADQQPSAVYYDYDEAIDASRREDKPLFVDFTGYGCVNCRKMEATVFADERVSDALRSNFITVRLYVDDRTPLPSPVIANEKKLRTVGDKWAFLETYKFGYAAQPFYLILDSDGMPLTYGYAYDEDVDKFLRWININ